MVLQKGGAAQTSKAMYKKLTDAERAAFENAIFVSPSASQQPQHRLRNYSRLFQVSVIFGSAYAVYVMLAGAFWGDNILNVASDGAKSPILSYLWNTRLVFIFCLLIGFHLSFRYHRGFGIVAIIVASHAWYRFTSDLWLFPLILENSASVTMQIRVFLRPLFLFSATWVAIEYHLVQFQARD